MPFLVPSRAENEWKISSECPVLKGVHERSLNAAVVSVLLWTLRTLDSELEMLRREDNKDSSVDLAYVTRGNMLLFLSFVFFVTNSIDFCVHIHV